jgi:hypothetical protein
MVLLDLRGCEQHSGGKQGTTSACIQKDNNGRAPKSYQLVATHRSGD